MRPRESISVLCVCAFTKPGSSSLRRADARLAEPRPQLAGQATS